MQQVRIGGRAYRVRTQVVIEEVGCEQADASGEVHPGDGGCFEVMLSEDDAASIDKSEQAVLGTAWPAMRNALAAHLREVSQKKRRAR